MKLGRGNGNRIAVRFPFACLVFLASVPLAAAAPTELVEQSPASITPVAPGTVLVDFGRVAFGNLALLPPVAARGALSLRFGEALADGRVDRHPPGSVRYAEVAATLSGTPVIVAPPPDPRNTRPPAVRTPARRGVLLPFRWVEITGWPGRLAPAEIRRRAVFVAGWRDDAAQFRSSDGMLNRVWDLCHYSIKATSFAGVFVDGDRERTAYEADAYLNQLSYYAGDPDPRMPRDTFERLLRHPTWPSEWAPHLVFIAYADWMETGDRHWLAAHYEALKTKLLDDRVGPDGLVTSTPKQIAWGDLVDWPPGERDGFVFRPVNTVINAFHLRALTLMARLARALGRTAEADEFARREHAAEQVFVAKLFDPRARLFRDGEGAEHHSVHANLFPLAFGLVPRPERRHVAAWLGGRGMACSVYAAQYLLEGLFENDQAATALHLITAPGDRSWRHMVESGTTITWEAWDQKYKPNQDWTHAWGAAPANLLPRFVLGVRPLTPGWAEAAIQPHPGGLAWCEGKVPTPRGPILVRWHHPGRLRLALTLPPGITARVMLPAAPDDRGVSSAGRPVAAHRRGPWWVLDQPVAGTTTLDVD